MEKKKALKRLALFIGAELFAVTLTVIIFDPFYQYHAPLSGMKAVLYDRDNQVPGTVRNFSYDTVLLGSSVAENFDTSYIEEQFQAKTVKIIRSNGSAADLLYFMETAHEKQDIKRVFWCMDIFALTADTDITVTAEKVPNYYLYTEKISDDAAYLFNKEIILEKIPRMLHDNRLSRNTDGRAYDWSEGKEFNAKRAMGAYIKPSFPTIPERREYAASWEEAPLPEVPFLKGNMEMILNEIRSCPETDYIIFFPPYSMLWWDNGYTGGVSEQYFSVLEYAFPLLLSCENVELYYFQNDKDIVCDLDNYMDMIHYSPEINQYMLESIAAGKHRVTKENAEEVLLSMRRLYEYMITEGIFEYYK